MLGERDYKVYEVCPSCGQKQFYIRYAPMPEGKQFSPDDRVILGKWCRKCGYAEYD